MPIFRSFDRAIRIINLVKITDNYRGWKKSNLLIGRQNAEFRGNE